MRHGFARTRALLNEYRPPQSGEEHQQCFSSARRTRLGEDLERAGEAVFEHNEQPIVITQALTVLRVKGLSRHLGEQQRPVIVQLNRKLSFHG